MSLELQSHHGIPEPIEPFLPRLSVPSLSSLSLLYTIAFLFRAAPADFACPRTLREKGGQAQKCLGLDFYG